jgi:chromosome partitioning protein
MAEIIAISNQKGGVGKTTTSVNLAACLGAYGHKTLLVDVDPQGNATTAVGIDARKVPTTLYRTLIGLDTPDPIEIGPSVPNLWVIPSNMDLIAADYDLMDSDQREWRLRNVLRSVDQDFEYIIIDSPPSLSLLSINTLAAADWVLVPVQAEFMALEGLAHLTGTIERVRDNHNPGLKLMGICVTLFDGRTRLAVEVANELENAFPGKVFKTRISRTVRLSEAPSHGKPIIYYDPQSTGSYSYQQLTEEVIHACKTARTG